MAKLTQPLGSSEARGKLGGLVYNTWRGISYVKAKATPGNQNTNRRLAVRALTKQCTSRWQSISDAQRSLWNFYASIHPDPDWTGNPRRLSGYNYFVRSNFRLLDLGLSILDNPPVRPNQFPLATLSAEASGSSIEVSWTLPAGAVASEFKVDIWYSPPLSAGVQPKLELTKHKVYVSAEDGSHTTPEISRGSYGVFARTIDESSGLASPWLLASVSLGEGVPLAQGPFLPLDSSNLDSGTTPWEDPALIQLEDSSFSYLDHPADETSDGLLGNYFDFSIPPAATIVGIKLDLLLTNSLTCKLTVQAYLDGLVGDYTNQFIGVIVDPTWFSFGSQSDLWGFAWSPADINSIDFGFVSSLSEVDEGIAAFNIDCYTVTVYYTI